MSGEHGKLCMLEISEKVNVKDHTNVMMDMVDEHAINHPELTPNQVWNHIKETLDKKSNNSWIGKNDA